LCDTVLHTLQPLADSCCHVIDGETEARRV
jgi:hypothetical protein